MSEHCCELARVLPQRTLSLAVFVCVRVRARSCVRVAFTCALRVVRVAVSARARAQNVGECGRTHLTSSSSSSFGVVRSFCRRHAHTAQLKFVLDNAQSNFARIYAATCLNKLINWQWNSFSVQTRVDIRTFDLRQRGNAFALNSFSSSSSSFVYCVLCAWRAGNYVLNLLAERGPSLSPELRIPLLSILAKITKNGWFDAEDCVSCFVVLVFEFCRSTTLNFKLYSNK